MFWAFEIYYFMSLEKGQFVSFATLKGSSISKNWKKFLIPLPSQTFTKAEWQDLKLKQKKETSLGKTKSLEFHWPNLKEIYYELFEGECLPCI